MLLLLHTTEDGVPLQAKATPGLDFLLYFLSFLVFFFPLFFSVLPCCVPSQALCLERVLAD
jgi:hypothetical protein